MTTTQERRPRGRSGRNDAGAPGSRAWSCGRPASSGCSRSSRSSRPRRGDGWSPRRGSGLPVEASLVGTVILATAGVGLMLLATGLRRRKRRAWQLAVLMCAVIIASHALGRHPIPPLVVALVLLIGLLLTRREFDAMPDPVGRLVALRLVLQLLAAGFVIVTAMLVFVRPTFLVGRPSIGEKLAHAALSLIGVEGPVEFRIEWYDDLTAAVGLTFGVGALVLGGYFLLRSAEPRPQLSADDVDGHPRPARPPRRRRLAGLLRAAPRQVGGVLGVREGGGGLPRGGRRRARVRAIRSGTSRPGRGRSRSSSRCAGATGGCPRCSGCSETGRAGVVPGGAAWTPSSSGTRPSSTSRPSRCRAARCAPCARPCRGSSAPATRPRSGGCATCPDAELVTLRACVARWRGGPDERGFSMALSRAGDAEADPEAVVVVAAWRASPEGPPAVRAVGHRGALARPHDPRPGGQPRTA